MAATQNRAMVTPTVTRGGSPCLPAEGVGFTPDQVSWLADPPTPRAFPAF